MNVKYKLENLDGSESEEFTVDVGEKDILVAYYEGGRTERDIVMNLLKDTLENNLSAMLIPPFMKLKVLRITGEEDDV